LQRRLRIGYTRSARLVDQLEEAGIVGPAKSGSSPREILDYGGLSGTGVEDASPGGAAEAPAKEQSLGSPNPPHDSAEAKQAEPSV